VHRFIVRDSEVSKQISAWSIPENEKKVLVIYRPAKYELILVLKNDSMSVLVFSIYLTLSLYLV